MTVRHSCPGDRVAGSHRFQHHGWRPLPGTPQMKRTLTWRPYVSIIITYKRSCLPEPSLSCVKRTNIEENKAQPHADAKVGERKPSRATAHRGHFYSRMAGDTPSGAHCTLRILLSHTRQSCVKEWALSLPVRRLSPQHLALILSSGS